LSGWTRQISTRMGLVNIMNKFFLKKSFSFTLVFILLLGAFIFVPKNEALAEEAEEKIEIYLFYSSTCTHCANELSFLEQMENKYPQLDVKELLFSQNAKLATEFYEQYDVPIDVHGYVPISFIGERFFLGYDSDNITGEEIEEYIVSLIQGEDSSQGTSTPISSVKFFGLEINVSKFSPLPLAIILGALDGFNACAMVALAFLLTVLVATGIRKRVILIGGTFILVSGIVYFLFISAWLNLFLVSKNLGLITLISGLIIVFFSLILLKDYYYGIICKLCAIKPGKQGFFIRSQKKLLDKMKNLTSSKIPLPLMLLGVILVAIGVNSVDLVCSFGFPLAFTRILSNLQISTFSYYFYILIYIIFFMLDDFLIFLVAVFTLRITAVSEKYLKAVKLISGIVLLFLGLILLVKPELLAFI